MYMTGNEVAKFVEKGSYVYRVSGFLFLLATLELQNVHDR